MVTTRSKSFLWFWKTDASWGRKKSILKDNYSLIYKDHHQAFHDNDLNCRSKIAEFQNWFLFTSYGVSHTVQKLRIEQKCSNIKTIHHMPQSRCCTVLPSLSFQKHHHYLLLLHVDLLKNLEMMSHRTKWGKILYLTRIASRVSPGLGFLQDYGAVRSVP